MRRIARALGVLVGAALAPACTNDPYPGADQGRKVFYTHYREAPRTLDPAVAYTTGAHAITGNVYDTLLEYHYLKRPYTLIPALAREVPVARHLPDGRVAYRFELRPDLLFHADPCFEPYHEGARTRAVLAADLAFELQRIADPAVNSPVMEPFSNLSGFREFSQALVARRQSDSGFAARPVHEQYAELGGIEGVRVLGEATLEIVLGTPYPQILYWFAMPFTTPVPWEAVAYYDGEEGREHFADHPVGTGPYRLAVYRKHDRMILEKSEEWYGVRHPEWRAPGATFPTEGAPGDLEAGRIPPRLAGQPLPFVERMEVRREKESIPAFHKFLQGYYDAAGVIRESFDKVIREDRLSPEMEALGIELEKSVIPAVYYLGFNMEDPVIGRASGARARLPSRRCPRACSATIPSTATPTARSTSSAPGSSSPRVATRAASTPRPASPCGSPSTPTTPRRRACSATSSSSRPGASSASTCRWPPPTTISSRRRCATVPTSSSYGAGWPTTRTPRTSTFCSGRRWPARRAAAPTPRTSPTHASTSSSSP
jgi:ABC-type transport system substrate-binding protein